MSSVKSTLGLGVSGNKKSQVQSLLKQNATRVFDKNFFDVVINSWNGNGSEVLTLEPGPAVQIGNIYRYPSGINLTVGVREGTVPFLFWHGYNQSLKNLFIKVTGSLQIDAVFSGQLLSGDSAVEDFSNFSSGENVYDLGAYSRWFAPKPRIIKGYRAAGVEEFSKFPSGVLDKNQSDTSGGIFKSMYWGWSEDVLIFNAVYAEGNDTYSQYPSGTLSYLDTYTQTGNGYLYTGSFIRGFPANFTDFFDYAAGYKDIFENFNYNYTTTYTAAGGPPGPKTIFIRPQFLTIFNPFDYTAGPLDKFDNPWLNYQGDIIKTASFRIEPQWLGGYDTFETYATGDITNLTNTLITYSPLVNFSGKILPSGG